MPNPGKPQSVKAVIGSRNQVKNLPIEINIVIPDPPRRLDESGLRAWNDVWQLGWLNPKSDLEAVALLCERLDERDQLRSFVLENVDAWRERSALRQLEDQIETSFKSLIMTPVDRQKAGVNEAKTQTKLEQLLSLKAARND